MRVEVQLFATLSAYLPGASDGTSATLEVADRSTVGQLVRLLEIPDGMPAIVLVNGRDAAPEQVLQDGDVLVMFPPLAGGH